MSRATESFLDTLHAALAMGLFDELRRAMERAEADPHNPDAAVPPQLLGQLIRFLASNGVTSAAGSKRIIDLQEQVTKYDLDLDDIALNDKHAN